jgi:hypothetical protein
VPRIQSIVADSRAAFALTTTTILHNIEKRFEHTPDLQALSWLNTEQVPAGLEADWRIPQFPLTPWHSCNIHPVPPVSQRGHAEPWQPDAQP